MAENSNRLGISALSKHNHGIAYPEEILVDKTIGEFSIKTNTGTVISDSYGNKLKTIYEKIKNKMNETGIYGSVYDVVDDMNLLYPIVKTVSGTSSWYDIKKPDGTKLRINFDKEITKLAFYTDIDIIKDGRIKENDISNVGVGIEWSEPSDINYARDEVCMCGGIGLSDYITIPKTDHIYINSIRIGHDDPETNLNETTVILNYIGILTEE